MSEKNKGGRPSLGDRAKNAPLNLRTSPDLRARIEEAADVNGRSLTLEVERRLLTSFIFDDSRGGPHIAALANMICAMIQTIEDREGHRWYEDFDTFQTVRAGVDRILAWRNPGLTDPKYWELNDRVAEAEERLQNARAAWAAFCTKYSPPPKSSRPSLFGSVLLDPDLSQLPDKVRALGERLRTTRDEAERDVREAKAAFEPKMTQAAERLEQIELKANRLADDIFDLVGPRTIDDGS